MSAGTAQHPKGDIGNLCLKIGIGAPVGFSKDPLSAEAIMVFFVYRKVPLLVYETRRPVCQDLGQHNMFDGESPVMFNTNGANGVSNFDSMVHPSSLDRNTNPA